MIKNIVCLCVFIFVTITVHADVYVKGVLHVEEGYRNGRLEPEFDVMHEWWFGKNKVTFVRHSWSDFKKVVWLPHLRFTLNKDKQCIYAINFKEKSFVQVPLPMNLLSHVDQSMTNILNAIQINGTVKKTSKKKIINKKNCDVYGVTERIDFLKKHYYDKDRIVMVTSDVPFNWQIVNELYQWMRSFFNPDKSYLSELEGMKGFVLATKEILFLHGYQVKMSFKVLEISNKKAPENIYHTPKDFKKNEKFTMRELGGMMGTIYVILP